MGPMEKKKRLRQLIEEHYIAPITGPGKDETKGMAGKKAQSHKADSWVTAKNFGGRILVFSNTKKAVKEIAKYLWEDGYYADSIHGDKDQFEREEALEWFKKGEITVL